MKLLNPSMELKAIYNICNSKKVGGYLMASLNEDFFQHEPCVRAFSRIKSLVQSKGYVMNWDDLLSDPSLEEKYRKVLKLSESKKIKTEDKAKQLVAKLDKYRQLRIITNMADEILRKVREDNVDVDEMLSEAADSLGNAKTSSLMDDCFIHIGAQTNANDRVKDILKGATFNYIPTGFKAFDRVNRGLPLGSLVTIAANSGAGKSTAAEQMALNMSLWGAKVCYVPLEMDGDEMLQRMLANLGQTEMTSFINADKEFTGKDKVEIYKAYQKYRDKLAKKGNTLSIFNPPEDMSMEDILFLLKPYGYKVIIIDYIGLLKGIGGDDQWQKLGAAARFAKIYAGNTNSCVILCAQLSDEGQIKYSKAIKEHSSAMFTWVYDMLNNETGIVEVAMQKARNMKPIKFFLKMDFKYMQVRDVTEDEKAEAQSKAKSDSRKTRRERNDKLDEDLYSDVL